MMIIINKPVYYCEHCKKYRLTKHSMKLHESKCLYNPDRQCTAPYCPGNNISQEHIDFIKDHASWGSYHSDDDGSMHIGEDSVEELRKTMLDNCPICALAVVCQTKAQYKKEGIVFYWSYDFKPIHNKLYLEWCNENPNYAW